MDKSSTQKTNKTQAKNGIIDQVDLIDINRTFYPKASKYIFFTSVQGTFSRTDQTSDHKPSLGKCKETEIMVNIFSDHKAMRLDINYREKK